MKKIKAIIFEENGVLKSTLEHNYNNGAIDKQYVQIWDCCKNVKSIIAFCHKSHLTKNIDLISYVPDSILNINPLSKMPYANAKVRIYKSGKIVLQSYNTDVIIINEYGEMLVYGLYSQTTRKHISAFMKEYTNQDYYFAKKLYETEQRYNIFTDKYTPMYCESEDL